MQTICMNGMSQKPPINSFKWVEDLSQFKEDFINSDKGYFLKVDVEYPKNLFNLHRDLIFLPKRKKLQDVISLFATFMTKKTMLFT